MIFRGVLAGYKDIVKLDEYRRDIMKDAIHSHFGDILRCHWHLVVAADKVDFEKIVAPARL